MQMTVGDMIECLVFGMLLGKLKCDEPVPLELLEGRHEDPVEYLARKYGIGSDADGQHRREDSK